jgi:hypothetical protein
MMKKRKSVLYFFANGRRGIKSALGSGWKGRFGVLAGHYARG